MAADLRVIIEADGGARGNPGPAGYGAVVREAGTGEVLVERSEALGVTTNNVAEYSGLIAGLTAAAELGASRVEVRMDSKLVVEQMSGRWQIKHPGLRPLAARAAALVHQFDAVSFDWIPRERNKHADRLANEAMDAAAGKPSRTGGPGIGSPAGRAAAAGGGGGAAGSGRTGAGPTGVGGSGGVPANSAGGERERRVAAPDSPARAKAREVAARAAGNPTAAPASAQPAPASAQPAPTSAQPAPASAQPVAAPSSSAVGQAASTGGVTRSWAPPLTPPVRLILVRHGETEMTRQRRYSGRGDVPLSPYGLAQATAAAARVATLAAQSAAQHSTVQHSAGQDSGAQPPAGQDSGARLPADETGVRTPRAGTTTGAQPAGLPPVPEAGVPVAGPLTAIVSSPLARCARTAELIAQAAGGPPMSLDEDLIECDFGAWEGLTFGDASERWPTEMAAWLADPAVPPPGGESFRQVATRTSRALERLRQGRPGDIIAVVSHVSPIKLLLRDALGASDALLHRLYLDACGISVVDFWADGGVAVRLVNETAHLPAPPD